MKHNKGSASAPLASLDATRAELVALLLGRDRDPQRIPRRYPSHASGPLSFGQESLWFLAELNPDSPAYHVPLAFRIDGPLDPRALSVAVAELAMRHETLRTRFDMHNGRPIQMVDPAVIAPTLRVVDAPKGQEALRKAMEDEAAKPFDLARDHAWRITLFRRSALAWSLSITLHHIICDTHSVAVLMRDLAAFYRAAIANEPPELSDLDIQYADFALWQRARLGDASTADQLAFWKARLAGLPRTPLPADNPRPEQSGFAGEQLFTALSPTVAAGLRELARAEGATLFMLLVAMVQRVLSRWSGQREVTVGTPVASRTARQTEDLVGYFANTVLLRTRLDGVPTFRELLRAVRQTALDAYANQDVPFERVVAETHVQGDLARSSLFQAMVVLQQAEATLPAFPDVTLSPVAIGRHGAKFDLSLEFFEHEGGLAVRWEYAADVFRAATIERLGRDLVALAGQITDDPDRALTDDDVVNVASGPDVPIDTRRLVHEFFEEQVRQTPGAVAASLGDMSMSYAGLNERANRFAHELIARGVGPGAVVGLFFERSLELAVALVGTLKAGAAYLPLDVSAPEARLRELIADARVTIVATAPSMELALAGAAGSTPLCLVEPNAFGTRPSSDPLPRASVADLAYVIYTSGSTGKPKGVETSHAALLNRLLWMQETYRIGADDRVLQKTPYTFDVSVWEFLWPLMRGATLVLARPDGHRDAHYLRETIRERAITVLHFVPSMLEAFLAQSPDGRGCPSLRHVICSGEALTSSLVTRCFDAYPDIRLHNLYGPTEAAIDVTSFECRADHASPCVPIGAPIWNTQTHILDERLRPVAPGATGELYLGGIGLARGYRHRAALTAAAFVPDPFGAAPGARLYRTGDLARRDEDGRIEYLGRIDHQVKIRGVRIEPGEIESAVLATPWARECAVVVRERDGRRNLVACVRAPHGVMLDAQRMRAALREVLPDHLVPTMIEAWDRLPLTPNGKLDRRALMDGATTRASGHAGGAPSGDLETQLSRIWEDVLGRADIDPRTGFFDAGGDSILAVAVARRVAESLAPSFRVTDLFRHPTLRSMAAWLRQVVRTSDEPATVPVDTATKRSPSVPSYADCVAIIGASAHVPGAEDIAALWDNLRNGRETIEFLSPAQARHAGVPDDLLADPGYVGARATIEGKASFDAAFFRVTARDAELMDPQARHLLEHAWRAVEDAGYRASDISDTAVFMSASSTFYHAAAFTQAKAVLERSDEYVSWIWAQPGTLPTLVSHKLGLTGPSLFVHSNCSSSLTALSCAYRSIVSGESTRALVGAATILPYAPLGYLHQPGLHFSSDGHLKAFDRDADGMVSGEGVAVLLLKRADEAIADGDHIYALLRGIALNNDGADKAGFYAPGAAGQAAVIDSLLRTTGIDVESIGYVEAHGTGTPLGDPVEFGALCEAYRRHTDRVGFCGLGSIKSNMGHLDTAAGLAGCLKVILSLVHARIPPTLHFKAANVRIDLAGSPFHVVDRLADWPAGTTPRRAALSSFGIGGTNAHAIFEEWIEPPDAAQPADAAPRLLPLSARGEPQRDAYARAMLSFLDGIDEDANGQATLDRIAFTLQNGREEMRYRLAVVATSLDEARDRLQRHIAGETAVDGVYLGDAEQGNGTKAASEERAGRALDAWLGGGATRLLPEAWVSGVAFDWKRLHRERPPRRISLPTYPFDRQDYWIGGATPPASLAVTTDAAVDIVTAREAWIPVDATPVSTVVRRVLLVAPDASLTNLCTQAWRTHDADDGVVVIGLGDTDADGWRRALVEAATRHGAFNAIVYAGGMSRAADEVATMNALRFAQAFAAAGITCDQLLLCVAYDDARSQAHAESWIGLERSLRVLAPERSLGVLLNEGHLGDEASVRSWVGRVRAELGTATLRSVRHGRDGRYELRIEERSLPTGPSVIRQGGVYWITGGAGGLGARVARYLIERHAARVVLSGRRVLADAQRAGLLEGSEDRLIYVAADVTDEVAMHACAATAVERFGSIDGVFHVAGVIGEGSILEKTAQAFARVLAPKMRGTEVLDAVLRKHAPAFICYFSSTSAVLGDFGGGDYAIGNRFQMAWADRMSSADGIRRVAIDWPAWAEGMRGGDEDGRRTYLRSSGLHALEANEGLDILERCLADPSAHYVVMAGDRSRIERTLGLRDMPAAKMRAPVLTLPSEDPSWHGLTVKESLHDDLRRQVAELLRLADDKVTLHDNITDFGFDSITLAQWSRHLGRHFGIAFTPALFFTYSTIDKIATHLLAVHAPRMNAFYRPDTASRADTVPIATSTANVDAKPVLLRELVEDVAEPIAIIGMSGRFPQARDIGAFWSLLVEGRSAIEEIPLERFDWREPYANRAILGKWLGALPGVAEFDPLFFDISPREALGMDPRQRLLMQEAWNALENAAVGESLAATQKIGVFVGVEQGEYQQIAGSQGTLTSNHDAILASRLSYFLNLRGPAMAINTSCSSGLVAAHQACQSLRAGDCDTAIAAAVNLMLTPHAWWGMSQAGMLSEDGRCRAFDRRANGLVPGEAVVAVVLKRLSRAQADGDPIHAVIVGSGINYDGRTNGITAPNGAAQAELIGEVQARAKVDPHQIGYVVTHGTGTRLGDPVEINALDEVFGAKTPATGFCALTSVKGAVGHTFAAAGLVNLVCAVQALTQRTIPPSLYCEERSDYIDWSRSAFEVNRERREWVSATPRVAAVSAFGMSGTNAHMLVREYEAPALADEGGPAYWLLAVSAKSEEALRERLAALARTLRERTWSAAAVRSLGYTLLCGRQPFAHRCVVVAQDADHAIGLLERAAKGERAPRVFRGVVPHEFVGQKAVSTLGRQLLGTLAAMVPPPREDADEALHALADLFCQGYALTWPTLFGTSAPRRMALPTYPFAREHYWIEATQPEGVTAARETQAHPLLHAKESDVDGQRYAATFSGREFFLRDHRVHGTPVFPGVAYLEMALAALRDGGGAPPSRGMAWCLKHVAWVQPLAVLDTPATLRLDLTRVTDEDVGFDLYGISGQGVRQIHARGTGRWTNGASPAAVDLLAIEASTGARIDGTEAYRRLASAGLDYGPALRALAWAATGVDESGARCVLARLALPEEAREGASSWRLHPSLLDGALHASVALWSDARTAGHAWVPYALESVSIHREPGEFAYALLREAPGNTPELPTLQVRICDDAGNVCVVLDRLSARPATQPATTTYLGFAWREADADTSSPSDERRHVLWPARPSGADATERALTHEGVACAWLNPDGTRVAERYEDLAWRVTDYLQGIFRAGIDAPTLVQVVAPVDDAMAGGLAGLLRTAHLEQPLLRGQVVQMEPDLSPEAAVALLERDAADRHDIVRHEGGVRRVEHVAVLDTPSGTAPWKPDGVYVIAGGMGGLGRIFANEILLRQPSARVLLVGRSIVDEAALAVWRERGGKVEYFRADLTDRAATAELVAKVLQRHGRVDGVIHAAGVIRDEFLAKKTRGDHAAVMGAKLAAAVHLDEALGDMPLDLFVFFSSTSGLYGNVGQADYAAANAGLDAYATWRHERVNRGERHGRTLSIGWPLWADGGMRVPDAVKRIQRAEGRVPLAAKDGIEAFYAALSTHHARVHVLRLDNDAAERARVSSEPAEPVAPSTEPSPRRVTDERAFERDVLTYVKEVLSDTLRLPPERIEADAPFERYGLDSILALDLTAALERRFGSLSKTLFFEHQTLASLARHLATAHRSQLIDLLGSSPSASRAVAALHSVVLATEAQRIEAATPAAVGDMRPLPVVRDDIAIIGMSGRYPGADDLDAFWHNLREGRDTVDEVPAERWDHFRYLDDERGSIGKTYGRWGGFLDGVDEFDPLFFRISPVEAKVMDPQERLFLQCAYHAVEDAGYARHTLRDPAGDGESAVGVFVGVMYEEYQLYGAQAQALGQGLALSGSPSSIANRVSYFLDLHGPSLAVDTMCSSSLTAIHLACDSLRQGHCNMALAGGVNVTVHPNKYLMLAQGRFLSSDGRCRSFGEGGDGYVPSEGVGAVVLKRLSGAIADRDRILGVIRGSAVNHGGKTNGYAVPNPVQQARLIAGLLASSGVPARSIGYVEAHGTGTSLGDPIEITGLTQAFRAQTQDVGFCAIGSVKSNIGHAESAAGMAALAKVLLQMRHGERVPSLHSESLNPFIDFATTPFVVQHARAPWPRQVDEAGVESPRRAGISSFGAGGSNAHLIVEEYVADVARSTARGPFAIVLSAHTAEALDLCVVRLCEAVRDLEDEVLADVAYTLQVGREAMAFRLAFVADDMAMLRDRLHACAAGAETVPGVHRDEVRRGKGALAAFVADHDVRDMVAAWIGKRKFDALLGYWVKGLTVDWEGLYAGTDIPPRRMGLPGYPFAKERYWIGAREIGLDQPRAASPADGMWRVLRRHWVPAPSSANDVRDGRIVVLAEEGAVDDATALAASLGRAEVVRVREVSVADMRWGDFECLVHLVADATPRSGTEWIACVQAWMVARMAPGGRALGVTLVKGHTAVPRGGTLPAGLYRTLSGEYRRIQASHVTLRRGDGEGERTWIEHCVRELADAGADMDVCYLDGARHVARLADIEVGAPAPLDWSPGHALWITGGVRGIGYACAEHFVRAHGVRRLVLTGREAFPDRSDWESHASAPTAIGRKIRAIRRLEALGAEVAVETVDLSDAAALGKAMHRLCAAMGPIGGVVHCAGFADAETPAFIHKQQKILDAVFAPKVGGVDTLLRCLRDHRGARFVVAFSSISALAPALAAGQLDYAMANAYMDAVAEDGEVAGVPLLSVQWGSWKESGMGEVRSRAYGELGLLSHDDAQGLAMLDRLIAADVRGVVAPLRVDDARFDADILMSRPQPEPAPGTRSGHDKKAAKSASSTEYASTHVRDWLRELFAEQLQMDVRRLDIDVPLTDYGVDSVLLMQAMATIGSRVGARLDPS
ncbi:non-ribosomal peptide synthetase, partial [Xanthomonas arboricola]|uniref:non-ribosomal peptide synthetase n=1 Tax=Xanthomonas arboricola TaxID=56448 RepID=UPI00160D9180